MIGRTLRTLAALLFATSMTILTIHSALAAHFIYRAQDPGLQKPLVLGTENYVQRTWVWGSYTFWTADAAIRDDARAAIGNWTAAIPQLRYWEDYDPSYDQLTIKWESNGCPVLALGCINVVGWFYDDIHDASYQNKVVISIDSTQPWTPAQRRSALAHELGHLYGLHERYIEATLGCNDNDFTVMDAFKNDLNHCDGLDGPSFEDTARVFTYWEMGQMTWLQPQIVGSDIKWEWTDHAWAEWYQQFNAFWWDGSQWVQYVQWYEFNSRVGVHWETENRTLTLSTTPPPESRGHWHGAMGHPWFANFQYVASNRTESPVIFVPGPPAPPALVGHWRLDDGQQDPGTTTAQDSSGSGNHGALWNGPAWVPGRVGYALSFDGVNDYVNVSDSPSLTFGNGAVDEPFSVSLWAKPDVITGKVNGLVSKAIEYNQGEYALLLEWARVTFRVIDDSARASLARNADNAVSTPGVWYHIVGTYDGSRTATGIAIYVNGVLVSSAEAPTGTYVAMRNTSYSVLIGDYRPTEADNFDGLLDEVRIYNYALPVAEVQALYTNPGG